MGDGINSIPVAFCWKFPVWKAVRRHCHNMSWGHGYVKEGTCDSYNESSFRSKGQRSELDRNNLLYIYYINNIYMWFFRSQLPERVFTIAEYDCYGLLWAVGPSGVFGKVQDHFIFHGSGIGLALRLCLVLCAGKPFWKHRQMFNLQPCGNRFVWK